MNTHYTGFTVNAAAIIKSIPEGKVLTYGRIAGLAGNPVAARQVSWILHSLSKKMGLPWHRVINSRGTISIKTTDGKEYQRYLLEREGVKVSDDYEINMGKYLWKVY